MPSCNCVIVCFYGVLRIVLLLDWITKTSHAARLLAHRTCSSTNIVLRPTCEVQLHQLLIPWKSDLCTTRTADSHQSRLRVPNCIFQANPTRAFKGPAAVALPLDIISTLYVILEMMLNSSHQAQTTDYSKHHAQISASCATLSTMRKSTHHALL